MRNFLTLIGLFILVISCNSYSTSWAHDLASLVQVSYATQNQIDSWTCTICSSFQVKSQKSFFSSVADIQGYGAYYPKRNAIIIAFRGSVDFKNWVYNLNTITTSYPSCQKCSVHLGFYDAYKGVAPLVRTVVQQLTSLYRDADIIITGHSLGGAMAIHCALDIKEIFGRVNALYAFGQPRVGNQNFADYTQGKISSYFRVINYQDMVPHVPQSILGFKHGGTEIWYSPRGMQTYFTCVSEDKNCSNSVSLFSMSTQDHHLANYMILRVVDSSKNIRTEEQIRILDNYSLEQIYLAEDRKVKQIKQLIKQELNL